MSSKNILTLTSDLGLSDHYVGNLKGVILSNTQNVVIVDITHECRTFDIAEAAYHIRSIFLDFPPETVHLISVDDEFEINREFPELSKLPCIMKCENQYFVANDNGIFTLISSGKEVQGFWEIEADLHEEQYVKFTAKSILAIAASKLINGELPEKVGKIKVKMHERIDRIPLTNEFEIIGEVIHIDGVGNLITNITRELFEKTRVENAPYTIYLRKKEYHIEQISLSYMDVAPGNAVAIFNSNDLLEIAINRANTGATGGANSLFGITLHQNIRIQFDPKGSKSSLEELF